MSELWCKDTASIDSIDRRLHTVERSDSCVCLRMQRLQMAALSFLLHVSLATSQDSLRVMDCVERLLRNDPQLRVQRTLLDQQQGAVAQAGAPFDLSTQLGLQASRDYTPLVSPLGIVFPTVTSGQYSVGLSQLLSLGATVSLNTGVQSQDITSDSVQDTRLQNRGFVSLNVNVPLLRNRGSIGERSALQGAVLELEAVRSDVLQSVNVRVTDVLTAYLDLWYNHRLLLMAQEMEERADRTRRDVEEYVKSDRRPASDLRQAESNWLSRSRDRIAARQSLAASYAQLLLVMGDSLPSSIVPPVPATVPMSFDNAVADGIDGVVLQRVALERRPDIRGLALRRQSSRMMLLAAQQRLEPQLDLGVTLGTNGFNYETSTSRFLTALTSNSTPMNATVRLDWRLPVQNSQALGELQVQQAAFDRSSIQEQDNIRSITINSRLAVERLREAQERLAISRRHVDIATAVLADEELRMKAGTSTLVDLGAMQDDLVSARIGLYTARRDVASAIIQLRFLASMFFRDNGETLSFDETSLYDLSELTR